MLAAGRALFGLVALLAPSTSARLLGFSVADDRPATRVFARLFGVRELFLAAVIWRTPRDREALRGMARMQAAVDTGDALSILVPLVRRQGIARPAAGMLVPALGAISLWLRLARRG